MHIWPISMPSARWDRSPTNRECGDVNGRLSHLAAPGRLWGLGLFGGARLATFFAAWLAMAVRPEQGLTEILTDWDGNWNEIATGDLYAPFDEGDPESIMRWRTLAFFPVLPLVTRGLHEISGLGIHVLGPVVSMVFGACAFALLGAYLFDKVGKDVAILAMAGMLFSPNGFVLSMFYTEGPMILFTVLTLRHLDHRRWWQAGLTATLGGLTRPTGFVLIVPCVVAAIAHIRRPDATPSRKWAALAAPALAPVGFLSWLAFVAWKTGEPTGYFRIQSEAWGARLDFGRAFFSEIWSLLTSVGYDLDARVSVLVVAVLGVGGIVLAIRQRMPATWISLAAALVLVTVVNARQASGARFLLPAFPLFVAWARAIPRSWAPAAIAVSATAMGALFIVSTTYWTYTP